MKEYVTMLYLSQLICDGENVEVNQPGYHVAAIKELLFELGIRGLPDTECEK